LRWSLYGGVLGRRPLCAAPRRRSLSLCLIGVDASASGSMRRRTLAWGVAVAGLVQFLWLRSLQRGQRVRAHRRVEPQIKRLFA
jgi:hypothetical protein